ncbi:hypothetical protein [Latilactobacillus fuchuensis]|uniref:hypothetical protein n=1 Tax=Latilactobacillus fuchuensis TaxID=164393 RepID=UPI0020C74FC4|nr:hypothetical protein [Latilactobacillus fuchuensis]MCP8857732.1 hypothetical protein [Latilactobacillus fuchuensis]
MKTNKNKPIEKNQSNRVNQTSNQARQETESSSLPTFNEVSQLMKDLTGDED